MSKLVGRFIREDQGQDLVEYALLLALIALVVVAGVRTFGNALFTFYTGLADRIGPLNAP
jgi:Flp pilus assembly pilin Flp